MRDWKSVKSMKPGTHGISGFIQELSVVPFYVTFYLQEQVDLYGKECGGTVFIDSTCGVLSKTVA